MRAVFAILANIKEGKRLAGCQTRHAGSVRSLVFAFQKVIRERMQCFSVAITKN